MQNAPLQVALNLLLFLIVKNLALFLSIVVTFLLALVLSRASHQAFCISSSIVQSLDMDEWGKLEECRLTHAFWGWDQLDPDAPQTQAVLRAIDLAAQAKIWLPAPYNKLQIQLNRKLRRVDINGLTYYPELHRLAEVSPWVELIMLRWVQQLRPDWSPQEQEVVSLFYSSLVMGSSNDQDMRWPHNVQSFSDYCKSPLRLVYHTHFCKLLVDFSQGNQKASLKNEVTVWSQYRLLSQLLSDQFAKQKSFFYQKLWMKKLMMRKKGFLLLSGDETEDPNAYAKRLVSLTEKDLNETAALQYLLRDISVERIQAVNIPSKLLKSLNQRAKQKHFVVEVYNGRLQRYMRLPDYGGASHRSSDTLNYELSVVWQCDLPSPGFTNIFPNTTKWLLVIQDCHGKQDNYRWNHFSAKTIKKWLLNQSQFQFALFHMPSVELAKKHYKKPGPSEKWKITQWMKWLRSDEPQVFQRSPLVKKVVAPIEGLSLYRWPESQHPE
jgi:hypothetical protein